MVPVAAQCTAAAGAHHYLTENGDPLHANQLDPRAGCLMARIRTIKPTFFKSDDVSVLPMRARLTWIGLWTQCDDQGRTKDHAKLIKADVWPLDSVSLVDIEEDLATLAAHGRIVRYEANGERYLAVTNWSRHQKINRPTESIIPPPPSTPDNRATGLGTGTAPTGLAPAEQCDSEPRGTGSYPQVSSHGGLSEPSRQEGKGKEGKGRERVREAPPSTPDPSVPTPEPPLQCPKHLNQTKPPPCGPCADARKTHARWAAERRARLAAAPMCPDHQGEPAHNCGRCRADRLADPDA
jgi:hypothetical protein